jgi:hypothetical protein
MSQIKKVEKKLSIILVFTFKKNIFVTDKEKTYMLYLEKK